MPQWSNAWRIASNLPSLLPLGVPAAYWLDLHAYQPEKVAQTLKQPMLFLLGEGDYHMGATLPSRQGNSG
ncbi:MAG TPA: hypothetical protein VF844_14065 [Ktedonobacteraceae bacterium]